MELQILYAATMCWRFYSRDTGNHCYFNQFLDSVSSYIIWATAITQKVQLWLLIAQMYVCMYVGR